MILFKYIYNTKIFPLLCAYKEQYFLKYNLFVSDEAIDLIGKLHVNDYEDTSSAYSSCSVPTVN